MMRHVQLQGSAIESGTISTEDGDDQISDDDFLSRVIAEERDTAISFLSVCPPVTR